MTSVHQNQTESLKFRFIEINVHPKKPNRIFMITNENIASCGQFYAHKCPDFHLQTTNTLH